MELKAEPREKFGKAVQSLREAGLIPAELYGHGTENRHLMVRKDDFRRIFKSAGESTVIYLDVNEKKEPALIQDVQEDYLTGDVLHVDFLKIKLDEKIKARVPLAFTGTAPAVKEKGGILNKTLADIEVEALPMDLPHSLSVDVSPLEDINQSLHVKDIEVPANVKLLVDPETVVVSVSPPLKEEEVVPPPSVEEVKVETEEKKAEREQTKEENATE